MSFKHIICSRRKGLSGVVTTLIILVFSVLLAVTAIYYTSGLTRAQMRSTGQEDIRYYKKHVWVEPLANGTDRCVVAFKLYNLGGKSVSIELIDVRGFEVDWSTVYFHTVNETTEPTLLYADLDYFDWASISGSSVMINGYDYTQATGNIWIESGNTIIAYIKMHEVVYKDNIGQPIPIGVGTVKANFLTECVAEAAT